MNQKTEIHLAKSPLNDDPAFFGWPFSGQTTPKTPGGAHDLEADPAPVVRARIMGTAHGVDVHEVKLWFYSARSELRLNLRTPWQNSIPDDSVVRLERDPVSRPDLDYDIEIYPPDHPDYVTMRGACTEALPGGQRWYGWQ